MDTNKKSNERRMIYDCFPFFNELDILELRLNILNDAVDKFVLVEGTRTHSNIEKPLYYRDHKERFQKYNDKIIHIVVDEYPEYQNSWTYENYQRNCIVKGLQGCEDKDIIMISDVDEIPDPKIIDQIVDLPGVKCLIQRMYYYYFNYVNTKYINWVGGTKVLDFLVLKENLLDENFVRYNDVSFPQYLNIGSTPTKIRLYTKCKYIRNGGWHFSYMGGLEAIISKMRATSHQEFDLNKITDKQYILERITKGEDIWERGHKYKTVQIDKTYPKYILDNLDKYRDYCFNDGKISIFSNLVALFSQEKIMLKEYIKRAGGKPLLKLVRLLRNL